MALHVSTCCILSATVLLAYEITCLTSSWTTVKEERKIILSQERTSHNLRLLGQDRALAEQTP